ncbi:DUF6134 family protein [Mucilaginibacter agri]|uniref:Uncharacterized protein n=1 Tax=Mucilaginibacter agri TaxID=2695265 RepID=A0A966DSG3_9SPHI|nr:DUF6134 family protein [Mucilaginibacter agri]NCD69580.1 hypothetical protein [Mucilaginibacter agri]
MIIASVIWLFKKYGLPFLISHNISLDILLNISRRTIVAIALMIIPPGAFAQDQILNYSVLHNGNTVGRMQLQQKQDGEDLYLKVTSEVKMRFIMSIAVNVQEDSHYRNGKLICSHVYRTVNGKEKANKYTKASGDCYQLIDDGKTGSLNQKQIGTNMTMLYLHEPAEGTQIYSDNFQQFILVKKTDTHTYRIDLPDGNYNYYTYTNGICSKAELHHSFYKIQIQLT